MHSLLQRIQSLFQAAFGETKLEDRTRDIQKQANSVAKHNDLADLRHEVGDLLSSTLQLCIECGWEPTELVSETLDRIEGRLAVYQKLNRKKKVGILRNDFDPIHNQHLAIIQTVLQSEQVDEVWLMPSYIPKRQSGAASAKDRLAMARLATQGMERVHVFNYEIEKEFEGDLYHLVKKLLGEREFRDRVEFSLIVKRSLAEEYHRASSSEKLDESIPFLIIDSKTGAAPKQNSWCDSPPHRSLKLEADESTLASKIGRAHV